jgi:hypothetical protein
MIHAPRRTLLALALLLGAAFCGPLAFAADPAPAAKAVSTVPNCADKAVDKNGKKLAGAAQSSFLKKCEAEAAAAAPSCEDKAIDKNGKKLAGAARTSFVKKCEAESGKPAK